MLRLITVRSRLVIAPIVRSPGKANLEIDRRRRDNVGAFQERITGNIGHEAQKPQGSPDSIQVRYENSEKKLFHASAFLTPT